MQPHEINALPDNVRRYVHDLETNADPAGVVRRNILVEDENRALRRLCKELVSTPRKILLCEKIFFTVWVIVMPSSFYLVGYLRGAGLISFFD